MAISPLARDRFRPKARRSQATVVDPLQPFKMSEKPGAIQINHSSPGNFLLIRDNLKPATFQDSREL